MPAQKREPNKNFIALVSDAAEEQRTVDGLVKSDHAVRRTFLGLMTAVLRRASTPGG